jgi:hypothetical protein
MELRAQDFRLPGQLEAVNARHPDISDQQVDPFVGEDAQSLIPIRCGEDGVARLRQYRCDCRPNLRIVIGNPAPDGALRLPGSHSVLNQIGANIGHGAT